MAPTLPPLILSAAFGMIVTEPPCAYAANRNVFVRPVVSGSVRDSAAVQMNAVCVDALFKT